MKDTFKITLTVKHERVESLNLTERELNIFSRLYEEREIENLNIEIKNIKIKAFGYAFVDFMSTNNQTIEENLKSYINKDYVEDLDLNSLILEELNKLEEIA